MKVIFASAMVALLATNYSSAFQVSTTIAFKPSTTLTTSIKMANFFEEQITKYYAPSEPLNGESQATTPEATAPPPQAVPQTPEIQPQQRMWNPLTQQPAAVSPPPPLPESSSPVGQVAIVFLGLPLLAAFTLQVSSFFSPPTGVKTVPAAPIAPIVKSRSTMAIPSLPITTAPSGAFVAGVVVPSQPITKQQVRALFNLWNDALATGDPAIVAQRYSKEGVLLPTLSDVPRNDVAGIKDYFVGFLQKKPVGKILEGDIFIGNNWAQDAGIYQFTFADGSVVKARYSFVYVYEDGRWMISHHHSSLMPQEVVRPQPITATQVRSLFGIWNDALATGDPQKVADRYSKDAVLLPTLSDKARYTNAQIADYFVGFLKKKPQGEILEGNIKIGSNWAQDAGIYEFTFQDGSKTRGRYSYIYTYENGQWMISNHHSSIMPEPAVAAMKKAAQMDAVIDRVSQMEQKISDMAVSNKMLEMEKKVAERDALNAKYP